MNTIMNTTRLHKWIIVLVLALGLAVTGTANASAVQTPMVEDLDAANYDIFDVDDLDVDGDLDVVTGEVTVTGPAGAAGNPGGDAPDVLTVTGGTGGNSTTTVAGIGGKIALTSGAGGTTEEAVSGKGGNIELTTGIGGGSYGIDETGGAGGDIKLTAGVGGKTMEHYAGDGGNITLTSGAGGRVDDVEIGGDGGDGGDIEITTGAGGAGYVNGSYGDVILVKNGGNVGIATTSPTRKLDVNGSANVAGTISMGTLLIPTKGTTGDPASPVEGQIYTNTFDNKVRVYSDGAWRDLATW